eukprot:TRINITY_DN8091_c0_g2_i3.p1 TRINITY_DN8091_c0_g2~~TRINITY_DN8091_c0_g2_i3.p1  ORF type:complete len:104 (+),score=13.18 TRINITY_DN8091_c0_g2_i3:32-343(+)
MKKHCEIDIVEEKNFWSLLACRIQVITTLTVMFLTTTLGSIYFHFTWIPFIYIYQPLQMAICELAIKAWLNFCSVSISSFRVLTESNILLLLSSLLFHTDTAM